MKKYWPSILPLLTLVVAAVAPQMQGLIAAHPSIAAGLALGYSVLTHWLPSPATP